MRLKSLEIYGFKSFGQKTILNFDQSISMIIGPNGSGKSNISDAIRWVLGEQSAKSLRGGKMTDVIFSGTDKKPPLNMAQVTMVLDNSDGYLDMPYDEIEVSRKTFRSGETQYSINRSTCRLRDIHTLFMDTGIGKDGYSIIGQGKIDEIINTGEKDRREFFEEATGISKLKYQIVESVKRLERTEENVRRLKDIKTQLKSRLNYISQEAKKAKKGLSLKAKFEEATFSYYHHAMINSENQLEDYKEDLKNKYIESEKNNINIKNINKKSQPLNSEREELGLKLEEFKTINKNIKANIEAATGKLELSKQKADFLLLDRERLFEEKNKLIFEQAEKLKNKEQRSLEIKEVEKKLEIISEKIQASEHKLKLIDKEKKILEKKLLDSKQILDTKKAKYEKVRFSLSESKTLKAFRNEEMIRLKKFLEKEEINLEKNIENYEISEKIFENLNKEYQKLIKNIKKLDIEIENIDKKREELEEYKRIEKNRLLDKQTNIDRIRNLIENHEGYFPSVQRFLKAADGNSQLAKNFIAPLNSLISIKGEEKAMEIAFGAALNNIVTEKTHQAKYCIDWLRKNRIGRITFLPIEQIKFFGEVPHPPIDEGIVGRALDFVKGPLKINTILESIIGRTWIIKDNDAGIRLRKESKFSRIRFITKEGDVFLPGGQIIGGYIHRQSINLLNRENQKEILEDNLIKIGNNIESIKKDLSEIISLNGEKREERERLRKKGRLLHEERRKIVENLSEKRTRIEIIKENFKANKEQLKVLENQRTSSDKIDLEKFENTKNKAKEEYLKITKDNEINRENNQKYSTKILIMKEQRDNKKRNLQNLINHKKEIEINIKKNEENILKNNIENTEINKNIKKENLINKRLKVYIESKSEEYKEIDLKQEDAYKTFKNIQFKLIKYDNELKKAFNIKNKIERDIETLSIKKENAEEKILLLIERIASDLGFSEAEARIRIRKIPEKNFSREDVNELKIKLRTMGSFSEKAIEEEKIVKKEFNFLEEQLKDLKKATIDLEDIIRNIEKEMRFQFKNGIKLINKNFDKVFSVLFNGGNASIVIGEGDILNAGIEIIARPPGKKTQNLNLLSGGEKALTAVSLLFAIFETRPSPFCVLDEIDAALDDANLVRYKDYLKSFTDDIQFIIITHRKLTMELADTIYGVTMGEDSVSRIIPLRLEDKK